MKFLFVRSDVCRQLPSDSTSRWTPLLLAIQFPLLGLARDFHPLDNAHAERTDDNQSVIINTDWIIYIEENSKDKVIVYWGVPLSNSQGSILARKQFKVSIHQLKEKMNIYDD